MKVFYTYRYSNVHEIEQQLNCFVSYFLYHLFSLQKKGGEKGDKVITNHLKGYNQETKITIGMRVIQGS